METSKRNEETDDQNYSIITSRIYSCQERKVIRRNQEKRNQEANDYYQVQSFIQDVIQKEAGLRL